MKEISAADLRMFIQMTVLGFKANPRMQGVGEVIEESFEERFKQKLAPPQERFTGTVTEAITVRVGEEKAKKNHLPK